MWEPRISVDGHFYPIIDERTARAALNGMCSTARALYRGPLALDEVQKRLDVMRYEWRRRIKELGLEGLPDDPFAADEPEEKTMSKTREEKIESMAAELKAGGITSKHMRGSSFASIYEVAERLLDAAEREAPKWPTSESIETYDDIINDHRVVNHEKKREALGAAMSVDPVIRAAIEVARYANSRPTNYLDINDVHDLLDAIENAGLL